MSTLYLVRHGQASFGKADYDRLSELGVRQCRLLGEFWVSRKVKLDAVYAGTLERQLASAAAAEEAFRAAGLSFPEVKTLAGFNEYDTAAILTGSLPEVISRHPEIAEHAARLAQGGKLDLAGNKRHFQLMFEKVMELWVSGSLNPEGLESWAGFKARVLDALELVMKEQGRGKTVCVFTSGGPVSVAIQKALGVDDKTALTLGWVIKNASITEFRFREESLSLFSFNCTPHLDDDSLITYR